MFSECILRSSCTVTVLLMASLLMAIHLLFDTSHCLLVSSLHCHNGNLSFGQLCLCLCLDVLYTQMQSKSQGTAIRLSFFLLQPPNQIHSATSFCFPTHLCFHCNPPIPVLISADYKALCLQCLWDSWPPQSQELCSMPLFLPFTLSPGEPGLPGHSPVALPPAASAALPAPGLGTALHESGMASLIK